MSRIIRQKTTLFLTFLAATLMLAVLSQSASFVSAQSDVATVIIQPSIGGTTTPGPGNYTYSNGTNILLTATPSAGYVFKYWVVSGDITPGHEGIPDSYFLQNDTGTYPIVPTFTGIDTLVFTTNPANITCGYGYTFSYQAVFQSTNASATDVATVIIQPSIGGTTIPANGTYTYANGTTFALTATPSAGYKFSYWVVSGNITSGHEGIPNSYFIQNDTGTYPIVPTFTGLDSLVFSTNPTNITCGFGYTFSYVAIFTPTTVSPSPSPSPTPTSTVTPTPTATLTPSPSPAQSAGLSTEWIVVIVVVVIIIIAAIAAVMMRRKK